MLFPAPGQLLFIIPLIPAFMSVFESIYHMF